jgi:hypothetical protein
VSEWSWNRILPWFAGLVLIAGLVAFGVVYIFDSGETVEVQQPAEQTPVTPVTNVGKNVALDPAARTVAGKFILTAVARKNLAESWTLTHPDLRAGYTLQEWKTGNIPVQPYPTNELDIAAMRVDESHPREAILEVALLPKEGAAVKPQTFYIGLKKVKDDWLVYYWAPHGVIPVPVTGD